jgi:7-cyano-7-deazaguanine synthase
MSIVTLVSGGLDSTLMAALANEDGIRQFPLFINYGQLSASREMAACKRNLKRIGLPAPENLNISGFGQLISSGLTDRTKRVFEDAFTPGRNLMFLLAGAAYGYQIGAEAVAIGLLDERLSIFPDQTRDFITRSEALIGQALGQAFKILTPLMEFSKADVVSLAKARGIERTYSCHAGTARPCGICVACREFAASER